VNILVSNDDGVHAPALLALKQALEPLGKVVVVTPDRDQSATSHSLTLHRPLRIHRHDGERFSIDGTPTDSVLIAFNGLLDEKPDLVISGINHGPNMGEDIFYSGTVAAAIEGAMQGVPAIAASLVTREPTDFVEPARFIARLAAQVMERGLPAKGVLNVTLPHRPWSEIQGVKLTRLGTRVYQDALIEKTDPRGRAYYWIGGEQPVWESEDGTDFHAIEHGFISITPLALDLTDYRAMVAMEAWTLAP